MYNSATIIGRLGQDVETRFTQSNVAVSNFSVATSERYKDKNGELQENTTWHKIVAWGRKAEIAQEYLKKGSLVHITGPIEHRDWEDKDGNKRTSTEIKALTLTMLDSKGESSSQTNSQSKPQKQADAAQKGTVNLDSNFDDMDDDLPF